MSSDSSIATAIAPLAIITECEWDAALFTTYALSLSFFETYLVRSGLKRNGCEEIWVIADQARYAEALVERQAKGVGQDYRVVPVALPLGVFHPKLVYLHGKKFDVILVGSGNLTIGGYGRNVEVVDGFRSDQQPGLFLQFADFLDALGQRGDFLNPDETWIDRFKDLARNAGSEATGAAPGIRLIHCVNHSIAEQLAAFTQEGDGTFSLRVLSPFFDEDASGICTLAESLSCPAVQIGLLPGHGDTSVFPFQKRFGAFKVSAATVEVENPHRTLHAKWIEVELKSGKRLVATGSVNATRQSMCTTNNIEVDVLRIEDGAEPPRLKWKETAAPTKRSASNFTGAGIGARVLVYASLTEGGRLHGAALAKDETAGAWDGCLTRADGQSAEFKIQVGSDGRFHERVPDSGIFESQSGLQLTLTQPLREGRCWVNNEWLLELSKVKNIPLGSIQRFLQGESDEEDDLAFLEFLSSKLHEVMPATRTVANPQGERPGKKEDLREGTISVAELQPGEATSVPLRADGVPQTVNQLTRLVSRMFGQLEQRLETIPPTRRAGGESEPDQEEDDDLDEDDGEIEEQRQERRQIGIEQFRHAIRELLHSGSELTRRTAAHWWILAELHHHLRHNPDIAAAQAFCREWLLNTSSVVSIRDPADKLDRIAITVTAILGANTLAPTGTKEALVGLHEALENSGATRISLAQLQSLIDPGWYSDLVDENCPSRAEGLVAVLSAATRRTEVVLLRAALQSRKPLPSGLALFKTGVGERLQRSAQRGEHVTLLDFRVGRTSCPKPSCGLSLPPSSLTELERLNLTLCVQCGTYIVKP